MSLSDFLDFLRKVGFLFALLDLSPYLAFIKKNQDDFNTPFRELFKIHIFTDEFFLHEDSFYFRYLTDALNIEVPGYASSAMSFFKPGYDGLVEFYQKDTFNLFEKAVPGSWRSFYRLKPEYLHDARKS